MSAEVHLSITPTKISKIPSEEALIEAGKEVLQSSLDWKQGKTFQNGKVKSFSRPKGQGDGAGWFCRVSEHTTEEGNFDAFWSKLGGESKPENEKNFVHEIKKVTLLKTISDNQHVWSIYYVFPAPLSPRVFTVCQTSWVTKSSPRTGIIVSVPVDPGDGALSALEEQGVRGRYVAVEGVMEREDGKIEWRMATSSSAGGNIPVFISDRSMASKISEDVPLFLKYLSSETPTKTAQPGPSATATASEPTTS